MAAPTISGPQWPSEPDDQDQHQSDAAGVGHRSESPEQRGLDEQARLRQIAELSERLAAIEARDQRQDGCGPDGVDEGPEGVGEAMAGVGKAMTGVATPAVASRPTANAGAIGSSGSSQTNRRRGREPGGHPEDDKGDPEAVAKAVCLRLLAVSARPRAGLAISLRQRGIPDDVANRVLDRFVEVGLIDDAAYAEAFVAAKHRERALGVSALRMELRRKGVADHTVDAAVGVLDQDAERERAQALIARRVDAAMAHGAVVARRRLVALLARRGYSAQLACQVVDAALTEYGAEAGGDWFG